MIQFNYNSISFRYCSHSREIIYKNSWNSEFITVSRRIALPLFSNIVLLCADETFGFIFPKNSIINNNRNGIGLCSYRKLNVFDFAHSRQIKFFFLSLSLLNELTLVRQMKQNDISSAAFEA